MNTPLDPITPVLVGAAATSQRFDKPGAGLDTTGLVVEAARAAIADAGATSLGPRVGWIAATRGLSALPDVARRVADALGADAHTVAAEVGIPQQTLINLAIKAVVRGDVDIAIVCGGETKYRLDVARRAGVEVPDHDQQGLIPDDVLIPDGELVARPEIEIGAVVPVQQYAMIENARRAAKGWSIDEHRDDIAGLWHSFNHVATNNPKAAFPAPMTVSEIREPGPANRAMAFPYNKWHNSQWGVDQAAALVICSVEAAEAAGVAKDKWVFPHVGLESSLSLTLSRRAELYRWPAMKVLGRAAEAHTGVSIAELDYLELYSCFPVAVRVQQGELGVDPGHRSTLTGGMAFAGGPFNNFVYQSLVEMVERLRSMPGSLGAVTAVSGLLTKPALGIWGTEPPPNGVLIADLVDESLAATGVVALDENPDGDGTIATYTVVYAGTAPARICAIVDLDSGDRAVAAMEDLDVAATATREEFIGTRVRVAGLDLHV